MQILMSNLALGRKETMYFLKFGKPAGGFMSW